MTTNQTNPIFQRATKTQSKLRLALVGVSGSGKTYSALAIARGLGSRVALIDTERGSAAKYADVFTFDTINLDDAFGDFSPRSYVRAINAAVAEGYDVIVIDSLSHAWIGKGGALEMHDMAVDRQKTKNSYVAWRDVTPDHNALVDAMVQARAHIIVTMRAKTEYVQETDERGNKQVRKIGLAPIQRDGLEYEFDLVADMDAGKMTVGKSRCTALTNAVIKHPNGQVSDALRAWLTDGESERELTPQERWHRWASTVVVNAATRDVVKTNFERAIAELDLESQKPVFDSLKSAVEWIKTQTAPATTSTGDAGTEQ